jgi:hypothetical protein
MEIEALSFSDRERPAQNSLAGHHRPQRQPGLGASTPGLSNDSQKVPGNAAASRNSS